MKSLIMAAIFVFSSSAFADFQVAESANDGLNNHSAIEQQKMINSSEQKRAEALEKMRELACKNREQALRKHASKMP